MTQEINGSIEKIVEAVREELYRTGGATPLMVYPLDSMRHYRTQLGLAEEAGRACLVVRMSGLTFVNGGSGGEVQVGEPAISRFPMYESSGGYSSKDTAVKFPELPNGISKEQRLRAQFGDHRHAAICKAMTYLAMAFNDRSEFCRKSPPAAYKGMEKDSTLKLVYHVDPLLDSNPLGKPDNSLGVAGISTVLKIRAWGTLNGSEDKDKKAAQSMMDNFFNESVLGFVKDKVFARPRAKDVLLALSGMDEIDDLIRILLYGGKGDRLLLLDMYEHFDAQFGVCGWDDAGRQRYIKILNQYEETKNSPDCAFKGHEDFIEKVKAAQRAVSMKD